MRYFFCFALSFSCFSTLFAQSEIHGIVKDQNQAPLAYVEVLAESDTGQTFQTLSMSNGQYAFNNLPAGRYLVTITVPIGYEMEGPTCSYEVVEVTPGLPQDVTFELQLRTGGIVFDFGSPGGGAIVPLTNGDFVVTVFASNLASVGLPAADTLIVDGFWHVPGGPTISTQATAAGAAGIYSSLGLTPTFYNLPNGRVRLVMSLHTAPYIDTDGAIANYTFHIDANSDNELLVGLDRLAFCLESAGAVSSNDALDVLSNNWVGKVMRTENP